MRSWNLVIESSASVIILFISDVADTFYSLGNLEMKEAGSQTSVAVKIELCSELETGGDYRLKTQSAL